MRVFAIAGKSLRQMWRDKLGLALTVLIAPLFVLLYAALLNDGTQSTVACLDADSSVVADVAQFAPDLTMVACPSTEATVRLRAAGLAEASSTTPPIAIEVSGDASAPGFTATSLAATLAVERYVESVRGQPPATTATIRGDGRSDRKTPFDLYVPNLLVFAMIMLVFSSAMATAREVERGTLERLRLTAMRPVEYLGGVALAQLSLGAVSVVLTLGTALALGFDAAVGALPWAALISFLTGLACVGIGTVVASVARSVAQAFAIASFFMFLLLLFSGAVFPIPDLWVLDALPTVHGAHALHGVLVLDMAAAELARPIGALAILSVLFFGIGGWRFGRLHKRFVHGART